MDTPDFVYVIPPYLLNTCVGHELHRELEWLDPELAIRNFFPVSSTRYRFRRPADLVNVSGSFCEDPELNRVILRKLKDKFAVLGVLGSSPPEDLSDDYIYELYETFESRLRGSDGEENDPTQARDPELETKQSPKQSLFQLPKYGEFLYGPGALRDLSALANSPLDALLTWAQESKEHKYYFHPYLLIDEKKSFLSPLPMYWTPLSLGPHLEVLQKKLAMEIDLENGYSLINLRLTSPMDPSPDDRPRDKRFHNFIANKEIHERAGIFYYEVHIEQTATESTEYKSIIHANDSSLSLGSSLFFNMGYAKRSIKFEKAAPSALDTLSIDLKALQHEMFLSSLHSTPHKLDKETSAFLGSEPGVSFEGSLAISFNNSCSYASYKSSDNARSSSLNLNRRFSQLNRHTPVDHETAKLDLDAPFHTHTRPAVEGKKNSRTDVVGFGVNFMNHSLFITLNGILIKEISEKDISSSNKFGDSIFEQGSETKSLYPIMGFLISDLSQPLKQGSEVPTSKILTNFGHKSFHFNINSYVERFKSEQKKILRQVVVDEIRNVSDVPIREVETAKFENKVSNIKNDPEILNDLIQGYLIQEGYLLTYLAFTTDLHNLVCNIRSDDVPMIDGDDRGKTLIEQSQATIRKSIREAITTNAYSEAMGLLRLHYPHLKSLPALIFELEVLQFIESLVQLMAARKVMISLTEDLYHKSVTLAKALLAKCVNSPATYKVIGQLSGVLLANTDGDLSQLPVAKQAIENHSADTEILVNMVNMALLESGDCSANSRLETMVSRVAENIEKLSWDNKIPFKLVNFERDVLNS